MVSAILRAVEDDGSTAAPRHVTIQGDPCPDTWCTRPIHVTTLEGDDIFCSPDELEANE